MSKIVRFFIVFICILPLFSCSEQSKKDTAYCFSIVFEKHENNPAVTMYCKIHGEEENGKMNDASFTFSSASFTEAIEKSSMHSHEIYFSSTKAIYFSDEVSTAEREQIILHFLNNTKYQASVYSYSPADKPETDKQVLHTLALEVCKNEKIKQDEKINYILSLKELRSKDKLKEEQH